MDFITPIVLRYGFPGIVGAIIGGATLTLSTQIICNLLETRKWLAPVLGALAGFGLAVFLTTTFT